MQVYQQLVFAFIKSAPPGSFIYLWSPPENEYHRPSNSSLTILLCNCRSSSVVLEFDLDLDQQITARHKDKCELTTVIMRSQQLQLEGNIQVDGELKFMLSGGGPRIQSRIFERTDLSLRQYPKMEYMDKIKYYFSTCTVNARTSSSIRITTRIFQLRSHPHATHSYLPSAQLKFGGC